MAETGMVITISRQEGSGGDEIAQELARKFKLNYLDKEIIQIAARRLKISEAELAEFDDKILPRMEELRQLVVEPEYRDIPLSQVLVPDRNALGLVTEKPVMVERPHPKKPDEKQSELVNAYHHVVEQLIKEVAAKGKAIIVGRGANLVLKGRPGVLNVFIYAPLENRIERLAYLQQLDHKAAARRIEETDTQRAGYLRQYYGPDWANPDLYHLMINTAEMSLATAVTAIGQFAKEVEHAHQVKDQLEIHRSYNRLINQPSYTLKEASELLLISPDIMRQAVYRGELKSPVVNHRVGRIKREALVEWLSHSHS